VKANPTDSGYYLKSSVDLTIDPGQFKTVPTGIKLELPEGTDAEVRPRSGLASKFGCR
jgi:dUTP pyrophosphatase